MKKIVLLFILFLGAYGLNAQTASISGDAESMARQVEKGVFEIVMPSTVTAEDAEKTAGYYTEYFTVDFNATSKVAKITMVDNSQLGRRVITRFLLSNEVRELKFNGNNYTLSDFFMKYWQ